MSNSGIYQIRNTRNGKIYIGSTDNFNRRKSEHFSCLRNNKHSASKLQNSYNKTKDKSFFIFEILLICREDNLILYEQIFMDYYKPWYNGTLVAGRLFLTKEIIQKRIKSLKKTLSLPHQKERMRNRILGDKNPTKRPEVREKLRIKCGEEVRSRGEKHHMKRSEHRLRMVLENPGMRPAHKKRMTENNPSAKAVVELNSGKIFQKMKDAANLYKLDLSTIVKVCKKKRKATKGYRFCYLEDFNKLESAA
jgi:group I intron endonuclease